MFLRKHFSETDLKRIEDAVTHAEGGTSGEIVPCVVRRSGRYPIAAWRAGALGAGFGWGLSYQFLSWGDGSAWIAMGALVGWVLGRFVPFFEKLFSLQSELATQAKERAVDAFVEHQVFATHDRCGVLIYVSLFEHEVVVLADSGIHQKVKPGTWDHVCRAVTSSKNLADGIIEAIRLCSKTLAELGFTTSGAGRRNQLANKLTTSSESES